MYNLNIELMRLISERINIGDSKPNYQLTIKRKDKKGGYERAAFNMHGVTSISVDRRYNMAADELKVVFDNKAGMLSPDYSVLKEYKGVSNLPLSGFKEVLMPYNEISLHIGYGDELRKVFTGHISDISISEAQSSIEIECKNMFRKLLKPIDPIDKKALIYEETPAVLILIDLIKRAGIAENGYLIDVDEVEGNLFTIPSAEFQLGMFYSDAIQKILDVMNHRIYADREGVIRIKKVELYAQSDIHVWEIDDYVNMSSGEYHIDPQYIRNRVIIQTENDWQAFEDPYLKSYCNQEIISCGLMVPWAETKAQKWAVADKFFLDMRRKLRRIAIATKGNPSLEIGDLVKVTGLISTATAKYLVIGIQTNFSSSGYIEQIELEYTVTNSEHLCVEAEGKYDDVEVSTSEEETIKPVTISKRAEIINSALKWEGTLYQWGGDSAHNKNYYGMDCSHFIYAVLKEHGLQEEYLQARNLYPACDATTEELLQEGDLVFYSDSNSPSKIRHVGMYLGNGSVISALGNSKITTAGLARANKKGVTIHPIGWDSGIRFYGKVRGM